MALPPLTRIVRSAGILASTTAVSRVLGFVRDMLLAGLFGTAAQAQAFVVAFRLPNLLRDLVAEGAVTSAFVPVLSWYRAKGNMADFWRLSQALLIRMAVLLTGIGFAGWLAAPWIVRLMAPGFLEDPEKFALTVRLTRILFPFITLVGLWAYFMGVLNALDHFAMPALGPAILNVAMIAACIWYVPRVEPGVLALTVSIIIGGVVQLAVQVPVAVKLGFRWGWRWSHPASSEIMKLLGPRMIGSAAHQGSVLIHTALASLSAIVGDGAVAALYFANRLVQLPLALFGTASAQASLPSLSEQAAHGDMAGFQSTLVSVVRMIGFVILPSSVGLIALAEPIVAGLFERGAFDHRSTVMTSQALVCYSLGLLAYSVSKVFTGAFYALRDTWTPVKLAIEAVAVNVALSLLLMWPMQLSGLALAAALANMLNMIRLGRKMEARLGVALLLPAAGPLARMTGASVLMGAGSWGVWWLLRAAPMAVGLTAAIFSGLVFYLLACRLFRVQELSRVIKWLGSPPILMPLSVSE